MPSSVTSPVRDSVPKINEEIAVGEDIGFQRKWWIFERMIWSIFAILLIMAVLGCFGRGFLARAEAHSANGEIKIKYDRIQRTGTPSDITILLGSDTARKGQVRLSVSESLISEVGAERISPQPERTYVSPQGLTYVFPALQTPATIIISVEPSGPGKYPIMLSLPDLQASIQTQIFVVP